MKKFYVLIVLLVFPYLSMAAENELSWGGIELVIDSDSDIGNWLEVCAGQEGDFHLLFRKDGMYWYGQRHGTSWNTEAVTLLSFVEGYFSLSVQENHAVGVSYNSELPKLVTTNNASGSWIAPVPIPETNNAAQIDTCSHNGNNHIFWCQSGGKLFHTCSDQDTWITTQIAEPDGIDTSRLAIAAHPDPLIKDIHFVWYDQSSKSLEYAIHNGTEYTFSTVQVLDGCRWVGLGVLDGGVPYIGCLEIQNGSDYVLKSFYFINQAWQQDILVKDEVGSLESTVMAVDPLTSVPDHRVYFAYGVKDDGYVYQYRSPDESWNRGIIEPLGHLPWTMSISLTWDGYLNRAGLMISQTDTNEIYFLTGELVPDITLGVKLDMPSFVHPGDEFYVTGELWNYESPMTDIPVCFMLQVHNDFWLWPDWFMNEFACHVLDVPFGIMPLEVIPACVWPDTGSQTLSGLWFYGAMLTQDMSAILGGFAAIEWGFGPM
ncbi:hypothetical protein K8T06_13715 [bacterium]|nr:hypothetical protein [bacterium]